MNLFFNVFYFNGTDVALSWSFQVVLLISLAVHSWEKLYDLCRLLMSFEPGYQLCNLSILLLYFGVWSFHIWGKWGPRASLAWGHWWIHARPSTETEFYRVFGCWLGIVMRQLSLFFRWVSLRLPVSRRRSKNSDGHRKKTFAHIIQGLDQLTLSWDPVVGKEVVVGRWFSFPAKCRTLIVTIIK